jgi:hypothetical protein
MRIPIDVTYTDGRTETLVALPLELVAFERQFSLPISVFGTPGQQRIEHMLFLAYTAASRTQDLGTFDEWAATVAGIEGAEEAPEGSDPLDPSPSTGS